MIGTYLLKVKMNSIRNKANCSSIIVKNGGDLIIAWMWVVEKVFEPLLTPI